MPRQSRAGRFAQRIVVGLLSCMILHGCAAFLRHRGLHPEFTAPPIRRDGMRALIICTSHATLDPGRQRTGVFSSELTNPYYAFLSAGVHVDLASIAGGEIPVDPYSRRRYIQTDEDRRSDADVDFQQKLHHSIAIASVDPLRYDFVFIAGGWGASYDLGASEELGRVISAARANGAVLGAVCHGALGFLMAHEPDGSPLVRGKHVTAVTDRQVRQLNIRQTPMHPETELRRAGALFESETASRDVFANHVVVDGTLVTGQNQNAGSEVAYRMMELRGPAR